MQELGQEAELEPEAGGAEVEENASAAEAASMETAPPEIVFPEPVFPEMVSMDELLPGTGEGPAPPVEDVELRAVIEAIVYVAEEPLTVAQLSNALGQPAGRVSELLRELTAEFEKPEHGLAIREVAGGYKMATKAEHHDRVRNFVKSLKPPLKLSLAALETLAVIAYKQPVTGPEILDIRGVQGVGVLKTLLDRKLIAVAGRKNVVGKPILYKTTREFLLQFGLKDVSELPSLKEFEEIRRVAFADSEPAGAVEEAPLETPAGPPRGTTPAEREN
jgi:segregation and condensation protein B